MQQMDVDAAERALGTAVISELRRRNLLVSVAGALGDGAPGAGRGRGARVRARRRRRGRGPDGAAARAEAAVRRHLADRGQGVDQVTALTQTMVLSIEAYRSAGWSAAALLSDQLVDRAAGLRSPGDAITHAVRRRRKGVPWYAAAPPSFGDMALGRSVGVGLASDGHVEDMALAACLDCVVTHAHPRAAAASAALAVMIGALVRRPDGTDALAVLEAVVCSVDNGAVQGLLLAALHGEGRWDDAVPPHAPDALAGRGPVRHDDQRSCRGDRDGACTGRWPSDRRRHHRCPRRRDPWRRRAAGPSRRCRGSEPRFGASSTGPGDRPLDRLRPGR